MIESNHPANRGVLAYLRDPARLARSVSATKHRPQCLPSDAKDPYMTLGTHPDLVARVWDELGRSLPVDCRVIAYGMPALARPDTGVIIGLAGGTMMYALRLDADGAAEARAAGLSTVFRYPPLPRTRPEEIVVDAGTFGDTWVFGRWHVSEPQWLASGYLAAV